MNQFEKIPFGRVKFEGSELSYIAQAIHNGHISGDGDFTKRCQELLSKELDSPKVLLTTSCTDALEMSAILCDIKPGDEVIVPNFTFVSTINAFVLRGAKPVFVDIDPLTLNISPSEVEKAITKNTKALVVVHYAGVACDMDRLLQLSRQYNFKMIEDNAHGLFGKYKGKPLGSFGSLATLSFHETKNITCGEGGALAINDLDLIGRAEIIREKGTNRSQFFKGLVDKYTWVDIGSSFLPSDILAAFLLAQLEAKNQIQIRRHTIWNNYYSGLKSWAERHGVLLPTVPKECEHPAHLFYLIFPSLDLRTKFLAYMAEQKINSVFHYVPLNRTPMGLRLGGVDSKCPNSEKIADRLARLPLYPSLTDFEVSRTIEAVKSFDEN